MITLVHILSPLITLLFLSAAIILWRKVKDTSSSILLVSGLIVFITDILMQFLISWSGYGMVPDSPRAIATAINGWTHVAAFALYAITLIWILSSVPRRQTTNTKEAEQAAP
jgi:membrane protein implicated in regulation of membrane protease activity